MSQGVIEEFFRERPTRVRDLFQAGLALTGLSTFLGLMSLGARHAKESFPLVLMCGAFGLGCLIGAGVKWRKRRWGLRATPVGLSEVFGPDQERFYEWSEIRGVEETANEAGVVLTVKTSGREVKFDSSVEGWERLAARIRAQLAECQPPPASRAPKANQTEPQPVDLARLAPWLGAVPRRLRYPRSSYVKMVWAWVATMLGLLTFGLMARLGVLSGGLFYSVLMVFAAFLGSSYGLRHAQRRAEKAGLVVAKEGLTVMDEEGIERRFAWEELLHVQEVKRQGNFFAAPSVMARRMLAPKAIQVRTPWGYFEIAQGLEEYDHLLELLQGIMAERDQPLEYPAEIQMASDAALSRTRAPASPRPTDTSLSQAEKPGEEKPRLPQAVTETVPESGQVEEQVGR